MRSGVPLRSYGTMPAPLKSDHAYREVIMRVRRNIAMFLFMALIIQSFGFSGTAVADARHGQQYSERWCSQCHGVRLGQAPPDAKAPSFPELAAKP